MGSIDFILVKSVIANVHLLTTILDSLLIHTALIEMIRRFKQTETCLINETNYFVVFSFATRLLLSNHPVHLVQKVLTSPFLIVLLITEVGSLANLSDGWSLSRVEC